MPLRLGSLGSVLPPLNLAALERYWALIESWGEPPASLVGRLSEGAELLHAALVRNYPELSLAEVKEGLDLANFPAALAQLLEVSGLMAGAFRGNRRRGASRLGISLFPG